MASRNIDSNSRPSGPFEPDYPLQGHPLDLPMADVLTFTAAQRKRYVSKLLTALARVIQADKMALKKRVTMKKEMIDLRKLVRLPTDTYLRTDDKTFKRNVLGKGGPGSTHTFWSRHQMWKMETKFGNLEEQVLSKSPALVSQLTKLFDPEHKSKAGFRSPRHTAVRNALILIEFDKASGTAFPPFHARYFADKFLPTEGDSIVVDPCAGWGGRLIGTLCVPRLGHVQYIGVDPERRNQEAYEGLTRRATVYLKKEIPGPRSAKVFVAAFEDWVASKTAARLFGKVNLVMTSPPYFGAENYNPKNRAQSANRYKTYEAWREGFYRPLVKGAFNLLKPNGIFILNIANVAGAPKLERDARILAKEAGFIGNGFFKLALSSRPGVGGKRHVVQVDGALFKQEPVFCFRKPAL